VILVLKVEAKVSAVTQTTNFLPKIRIDFIYGVNKSNTTVELYEVAPEFIFSIAKTSVTRNKDKIPIGSPLSKVFPLDKDGSKTFVMVVRNDTEKAKYFTAVPHTVSPPEASLGVIFECLCNHHVYEIPPHMIWYRIVHIELPKDQRETLRNVKEITLTHQFIEVSAKDAATKYKTLIYNTDDGMRK
jgi:hypothetical protein